MHGPGSGLRSITARKTSQSAPMSLCDVGRNQREATGGEARGDRSAISRLVCEPGLDQRLIGNIALVGSNLDALKKHYRQA
jgi:hypothetical protein